MMRVETIPISSLRAAKMDRKGNQVKIPELWLGCAGVSISMKL